MVTLEIVKVPRSGPTPVHPINFPPFENLHLELLENKKKLKKGLPLIPVAPPKTKPKPLPPPKDPVPEPIPNDKEMVEELASTGKEEESVSTSDPIEQELGVDSGSSVEDSESSVADETTPEESTTEDDEIETFRQSIPPDEKEIFDEMTATEQRRYMCMDTENRERYQKETYLWKWRLLKRSYPVRKDLPEFNEHSDLHTMKISFDRTKKDLVLEDTVDSYRMYLVVAWLGIEYVCTQQLGVDMTGFTSSQTKMMHKYEKLLIELGERSYSKWGSNLPVEARLGLLILFQAGVFYLSKVMMAGNNPLFAEIFNGLTGQPPMQQAPAPQNSGPKRKMRGPNIRAEDIRNMRSSKDE